MDFFGQQEQARRETTKLIVLFVLAILLIVVAVYFAVMTGLFVAQFFQQQYYIRISVSDFWNPLIFTYTTLSILLLIGSGSLWRIWKLKNGGGAAVAEMLGGRPVPANIAEPLLRRLRNVVEEMAIASGLPVPPVYLLEESGINAFAAGFTPSDAIIAVTRGAVDLLNRDELQGVVAHEFSHILNGDMRLKMRMMGLLFGITLISDAGILLLTSRSSTRYSARQRGTHPAAIVLGFLLFLVGTIGLVCADLIKRAISRQREFLADAAAVQFTRNPLGLAGALKVIGGYKEGSRVRHPAANQASHFFFGNALKSSGTKDWWATHPPLIERIRRLDPSFKGSIKPIHTAQRQVDNLAEATASLAAASREHIRAVAADAERIVSMVGNPGHQELQRARRMLQEIPDLLRHGAQDPYLARSIVYALLLDEDKTMRSKQLDSLQKLVEANAFRETLDLQPLVSGLAPALRLPLLELCLPALKTLSVPQFRQFRHAVGLLIRADAAVSLFEFMLYHMLRRHLDPHFYHVTEVPTRYHRIDEVRDEVAIVLGFLVRAGKHADPASLYRELMVSLGLESPQPMPDASADELKRLKAALNRLEQCSPMLKKRILQACVAAILNDGQVRVREMESLRIVADAIGCPMPPLTIRGTG